MMIEPIYDRHGLYDEVLPRYEFAGMTDEDLLRHVLAPLVTSRGRPVLELGCGTGRMTSILREFVTTPICVDHSAAMLAAFHTRHADLTAVHATVQSYVAEQRRQHPQQMMDLIVACWSLNYPLLECFETNTGTAIVPRDPDDGRRDAESFLTALTGLLTPGGHLVTFFFDSDSVEQRFVTDLWEPIAPFPGTGRDYTRRLMLDHLDASHGVTDTRHYSGHMHAPDLRHAEQWFLDGHFKSFPALSGNDELRDTVRRFLATHTHDDGSVRIPAGVYVTIFTKA